MPRMRPDDLVKQRMWSALLNAAKRHHGQAADRGMVTQIAKDAGVSKAAVSDWKNGGNYPEPQTLRRLADLYRVSAEELSGYVEPSPHPERYGPADEVTTTAIDIAERLLDRLEPDAGLPKFAATARRAAELLMEGQSEAEVRGTLFDELTRDEE